MRGPVIGYLLRVAPLIILVACRVLLLLLLRPFITWPLMLACIGGMAVTLGFAAEHMWVDAARAGSATLTSALVLGLYSMLAQTIDPEHFDQAPGRERGAWMTGGHCHDDAE